MMIPIVKKKANNQILIADCVLYAERDLNMNIESRYR